VHTFIFFVMSLIASAIGAIAGIGGGVIIRPVLDSFHVMSAATVSFLSGCTVLSMSCYSTVRVQISGDNRLRVKIALPLGVGAALGGVLGKELFKRLSAMFENPDAVGAVQSACLMAVMLLTLLYTLRAAKIRTHSVKNPASIAGIGLLLGILSAFLGIGGGPINLMVLGYFFSMDIKTAAQNSLMTILISQIASLITTLVTRSVPAFSPLTLCLMVLGGVLGAAIGRTLNCRMRERHVSALFCAAMAVIILLSARNMLAYLQ